MAQSKQSASLNLQAIDAHPDWRPIRQLHRADDSWIALCAKGPAAQDGRRPWLEMGGIRSGELETMFPSIVRHLLKDSFFTINGMFEGRRQYERLRDGERVPFLSPHTDLQIVRRSEDNLRYLNAFYVDLDAHDCANDVPGILAGVMRLQDRGEIPVASMFVRSGRGVWILYFLCSDRDPTKPQEAFPEKVRKYLRIQRELVSRLTHLGADTSAKDAARCIRVPDSVNSDAPEATSQVKYWPQLDANGCIALYTLDRLSQRLGVPDSGIRSYQASKGTGHRSGWTARWRVVIEELQTLREIRGGFQKGSRSQAVFILTAAGSRIMRPEQLAQAVIELAENGCVPPLRRVTAVSKIERTLRWLKRHPANLIQHATCARMLRVTQDERQYLRHWFPVERERWSKQDARRAAIRQILGDLGATPSIRRMRDLLKDRGIAASLGILVADYRSLSIAHTEELFQNSKHVVSCYSSHKLNSRLDNTKLSRIAQQQARTAKRIGERRALIAEFVRQFGLVPTVRKMAELLGGRGCVAGRQTVASDYHALGYSEGSKAQQMPIAFALERAVPITGLRNGNDSGFRSHNIATEVG